MTQIGDGSEVAPGTRFGSYRVVSLLGRGGMGTTYLAVDDAGRDVVVKTIRADLAADPTFRSRFRREAQAARLFRSTLVARVWAFDCDADLPWLALERIDGPTLGEVIETGGPLRDERLLGFAADLADAVHAFFDQGLAHGDLTPNNIVLQDGERLKILDLGLTRPTADEAVTSEGPVFGTPYWEAPEVSAGFHPDSASDVNQWAKLVLFAGTGYPKVRDRAIREALDGLPEPLRGQVERCLHPVPDARLSPPELWRLTRRRTMVPGSDGATDNPTGDGRPPLPVAAAGRTAASPLPVAGAGRTVARSPLPAARVLSRTRRIDVAPPAAPAPPEDDGPSSRWPWIAAAAVAVAAVIAAVLALVAGHHSGFRGDVFAGPALDPHRWTTEIANDADVVVHNGAVLTLRFAPPDQQVSATLSNSCTFTGDFDVEVGYRLDTWPLANGGRVGLLSESDAIERISQPDNEYYAGQATNSVTETPTTDSAGYLRLVRSGTTTSGYERVQKTDPWRQVFTTTEAPVLAAHLDIKVWSDGNGINRQVALHDFKINQGGC